MSDKIKAQHLDRKAVLYVRQSSPHQVLHNQESRNLQYAMTDRLRHLGWQGWTSATAVFPLASVAVTSRVRSDASSAGDLCFHRGSRHG